MIKISISEKAFHTSKMIPHINEYEVYDTYETIGENTFSEIRMKEIKQTYDKICSGENRTNKELVLRWLVTQCYENDMEFKSVSHLIDLCDDKNETNKSLVSDIYFKYSDEKETRSLQQILYKKSKEVYVEASKVFTTIINMCCITAEPIYKYAKKKWILLDFNNKCTYTTDNVKRDRDSQMDIGDILFSLVPIEVTRFTMLHESDEQEFMWKFITQQDQTIVRPPETLDTTVNWLKSNGYCINSRDVAGNISKCLQALFDATQLNPKKPLYFTALKRVKGFMLDTDKNIICSDYIINNYSDDDLKQAFLLLDEYKDWFTGTEEIFIATVFKWGLFAPFNYVYKKVMNTQVEVPYLYGTGGVGKTTGYGGMVNHLWFDEKTSDFERSPDMYNTPYRFHNTLTKSTFPVCLDESKTVFEKDTDKSKDMLGHYKSAVEKNVLREIGGKAKGNKYVYSSFMCTSNGYIDDPEGAITRRSYLMDFSNKILKARDKASKDFRIEYKIGNEKSKLNGLRPIAHCFAKYIMEEGIDLFSNVWQDIVDEWLEQQFKKLDINMEWLKQWVPIKETVITQLEDAEAQISYAFQKVINSHRRQDDIDPTVYVWDLINGNYIAGLSAKSDLDGKYKSIIVTNPFLKELVYLGYIEHNMGLKNFANNYGFKYDGKSMRIGSTVTKGAVCDYEHFLRFVYGNDLPFVVAEELIENE